jgi:hypothetical protein
MFLNQRHATKMVQEIVDRKLAADKKKARRAAAPTKRAARPKVIKNAKAPSAKVTNTENAAGATPSTKASTAHKAVVANAVPTNVMLQTTSRSTTEASMDDDVSVCTELTDDNTFMTESTTDIDTIAGTNNIPKLDYTKIMAVDSSWDKIKTTNGYEEALGEQIILKMMELEPCTRNMLGLTSLRSPHFVTVSSNLVGMINVIVFFLGPDMHDIDDDLLELGMKYISEGFNAELFRILSKSVCNSLKVVLGVEEFSPPTEDAWKAVIDFMAIKMCPYQPSSQP